MPTFRDSFNSLNIVLHLERDSIVFVRELPEGTEDYSVSGVREIADILCRLARSHSDGAEGLGQLSRHLNNLSLAIGRRAKQLEKMPDGKAESFLIY